MSTSFIIFYVAIVSASSTCFLSDRNITCENGDCVQNGDDWHCECDSKLYHGKLCNALYECLDYANYPNGQFCSTKNQTCFYKNLCICYKNSDCPEGYYCGIIGFDGSCIEQRSAILGLIILYSIIGGVVGIGIIIVVCIVLYQFVFPYTYISCAKFARKIYGKFGRVADDKTEASPLV